MKRWLPTAMLVVPLAAPAGPPYLTDDPEPTDRGHYETYFFAEDAAATSGHDGAAGVDFNYGAADDLQLTVVLPFGWDVPRSGGATAAIGNIELAAEYRFFHQQDHGLDVAFFPRVFVPTGSSVAENHPSLLLPLWAQHTWVSWTAFAGVGCEIHRGGDSKDFCMLGAALTRKVDERLWIGAEVYHQTAETRGGRPGTDFAIGATYDLDDHLHFMASFGPGLQHTDSTDRTHWYAALLWTR